MLTSLVTGIITGFLVSIPPLGPIAFALISKGFKNEIKEGMAIALGSAFMDFVYCLIAFGGISLVLSFLPDKAGEFYNENVSSIIIILTYLGCMVVVVYGYKIMKSKIGFEEMEEKQSEKLQEAEEKAIEFTKHTHVPVVSKSSYTGLFMMGVMLCMSSITLPASWVAVVGYLKGYRIINTGIIDGLVFSAGAFAGTALWFYVLLRLITSNKHRINITTVNKLNIAAGITLFILGIILFVRASIEIFHLF
jgi:threonine/homoserine/homoserine lactone efflux protein